MGLDERLTGRASYEAITTAWLAMLEGFLLRSVHLIPRCLKAIK